MKPRFPCIYGAKNNICHEDPFRFIETLLPLPPGKVWNRLERYYKFDSRGARDRSECPSQNPQRSSLNNVELQIQQTSSKMASNRVGFSVKDVEMGRESEDTGGSNSRELSVVGPLPSETLQETAPKSSASARSGSASNGSYSKKFSLSPPSILKKRSNSIKGSGSVTAKTGASGFTGSVKTSSTGGSSTSGQYQGSKRTPRHVWYSRWLFLTLLCMVAASLGYLTYDVLTKNERYLADCLFGNIADYAIATISKNQKRKKLGMDSMGSVIGELQYSMSGWNLIV